MRIITTIKEMQEVSEALRKEKTIGFVPTMGYLHEGHLSLVRKARELADTVVVSIFVNPIQFGPKEDLAQYPRDFQRDRELLGQEKTDIIFFPSAEEMYPHNYATFVEVRELGHHLCGLKREGHFQGVTTVVTKLFNAVKPHYAIFGQKDYQQLKIIEKMVEDLNMDLEVVCCPTFREEDGLAMSSRNKYLSPDERQKALALHASIKKVQDLFGNGISDASILREEGKKVLADEAGVDIEYVTICSTDTLDDIEQVEKSSLYAVAARVGKTRLIDNTLLKDKT
jgi:pantoate--beta-alanine ligase